MSSRNQRNRKANKTIHAICRQRANTMIVVVCTRNEKLDLENVDSVSGLILAKLCDIPEENELVSFDEFEVTIFKMDGPRIEWVKVNRKPEKAE